METIYTNDTKTQQEIDSLAGRFYAESLSVNEVLTELADFKDKRFFLALDKVYEFAKELKGGLYASKLKGAIMDAYFEGER